MKTKHTKGEWKVRQHKKKPTNVIIANGKRVAVASIASEKYNKTLRNAEYPYLTDWTEVEANAKLIAQAPKMLETLTRVESSLVNLINEGRESFKPLLENVRETIKATE